MLYLFRFRGGQEKKKKGGGGVGNETGEEGIKREKKEVRIGKKSDSQPFHRRSSPSRRRSVDPGK